MGSVRSPNAFRSRRAAWPLHLALTVSFAPSKLFRRDVPLVLALAADDDQEQESYWRAPLEGATAAKPISHCWGGRSGIGSHFITGSVPKFAYHMRTRGLDKLNLTYANCCGSGGGRDLQSRQSYEDIQSGYDFYDGTAPFDPKKVHVTVSKTSASGVKRRKGLRKVSYGNPKCWQFSVQKVVRAKYEHCCAVRSVPNSEECVEQVAKFGNYVGKVNSGWWDKTWHAGREWREQTGWEAFWQRNFPAGEEGIKTGGPSEIEGADLQENCSMVRGYFRRRGRSGEEVGEDATSGNNAYNQATAAAITFEQHEEVFPCVVDYIENLKENVKDDPMLRTLGHHFQWDDMNFRPWMNRNLTRKAKGKIKSATTAKAETVIIQQPVAAKESAGVSTLDSNVGKQLGKSARQADVEWVNPLHLAVLAEVLVAKVFQPVVTQFADFWKTKVLGAGAGATASFNTTTAPRIKGICQGAKKGYEVELLRTFFLETLIRRSGVGVGVGEGADSGSTSNHNSDSDQTQSSATTSTTRSPSLLASVYSFFSASSSAPPPPQETSTDASSTATTTATALAVDTVAGTSVAAPKAAKAAPPVQGAASLSIQKERIRSFFTSTNFVDVIGTDFLGSNWLVWGHQDFGTDLRPALRNRWARYRRPPATAPPLLRLPPYAALTKTQTATRSTAAEAATVTAATPPTAAEGLNADLATEDQADFIYSNAFDHALEPQYLLEKVWSKVLKKNGLLILHWSNENSPVTLDAVDMFGGTVGQVCNLLRKTGAFRVVDVVRIPAMDWVVPDGMEEVIANPHLAYASSTAELDESERDGEAEFWRRSVFLTPGEYAYHRNGTRKKHFVKRFQETEFVIAQKIA